MRSVVLVHGAWHGGWCWDRVVPELATRGIEARTVDLPLTTLEDDAAVVRDAIAAAAGDGGGDDGIVLVGHSYGGAVITEAGNAPGVAHLVYVCAFVPDAGESVMGLAEANPGGKLGAALRFADDGTVTVDEASTVETFYADCDPDVAADAVGRLRPMQAAPFGQPVSAAAWRTVPSTYVVCTNDEAVPVALQRSFAERTTRHETLEASHSPFLSMPAALAGIIAAAS